MDRAAHHTSSAEVEIELAARWMGSEPADRRLLAWALAGAIVLHATVLFAHLPGWRSKPVRVDAPRAVGMQVQFLRPPAPPPPVEQKAEPKSVKKIPRPDPTPDEPEPEVAPPQPPAEPIAAVAPQPGPVRVQPGQGPGLIKRVEPIYPPVARAAQIQGTVELDAIIRQDGTVNDIKVLRSANKLLEQSAVEAVRQWRFTPGPYDVVLTVTVNFVLK
ncbi:MAG: energy transducer TonB [Acidobacteria bacterium]|nr:energy transducer TonB [Acidobacteriota bacterium]